MQITITKSQLTEAMFKWETDSRDGLTQSFEESRAQPAEIVAQEGAEFLWSLLTPKTNN